MLPPDEVAFEADVFLLKKAKAQELKAGLAPVPKPDAPTKLAEPPQPEPEPSASTEPARATAPTASALQARQLRLFGEVPPEAWNRLGTKLVPKLRTGTDLKVGVEFRVTVANDAAKTLVIASAKSRRQSALCLPVGNKDFTPLNLHSPLASKWESVI